MGLQAWQSDKQKTPRLSSTPEGKALMLVQFEMVLPHVLEQVCAGVTVNNAILGLRPMVVIDLGAFLRWLKKNPTYYSMYQEAREVRTEVWTGKMIEHAAGLDEKGLPSANDVSRDKLAVETYKWLVSAQNRKEYGETKQIEITQSISITAALSAGRSRVIEAQLVDDELDLLSNRQVRELSAAPVEDEDDDD